ncbi:MAG: SOS response-associated peptidase, partial [Gammaproteobacteria bacterium]|nr:SOS response-associated peptidase [Gammaproteobacteria bacterium]
MCGRFAFYSPHEAVARLFGVADAPAIEPRYNIAPTQYVASVRQGEEGRAVAMLHWGLVPSWAKERTIGARMINARGET